MVTTLEELKLSSLAPEWYTQDSYNLVKGDPEKDYKDAYLLPGETPFDMYMRVSKAAADRLNRQDLAQPFFDIMWKGWLGLATPVAANMGAERSLPISCYSSYAEDSINGIFDTLKEIAVMSSNGGGTSACLTEIRPKGSPIKGGGLSDGVVPWSYIYNATINRVSQGATRRGALALYLPIDHPDFKDFLKIRKANTDPESHCKYIHQGSIISDEFMMRVKQGDKEARQLWLENLNTRIQTGEPYLFFIDNANKANPPGYKKHGLSVKQSNLCCLTGDEVVLTSDGNYRIEDLVGKTVDIWDGNNSVTVNNFESKGKTNQLVKVTYKDKSSIKTTLNHRFPLKDGTFIFASDLVAGHEVLTISDMVTGLIESVEIIDCPPTEVFCCNIPTTGMFALADGRMTGNSEIMLHTDKDHSLVCCLSSLNLEKYDEWKDTNTVELSIYFLDGVMQEFIDKASTIPGMEKAVRFAIKSRALGLGVMGYHAYLQKNMIPFESEEAELFNVEAFSLIKNKAHKASRELAELFGEPEWCKETGMRNTHCIALAPTVSNSIICNSSAGIDPITAGAYVKDSKRGFITIYNSFLKDYLDSVGMDKEEVWHSIKANNGSVQHLEISDHAKKVFKTAREIDQEAVVRHAGARQPYIDQGQSVNLFFSSDLDSKKFNKVHLLAWELGLNSLYYCRTDAITSASDKQISPSVTVSKTNTEAEACDITNQECLSCHG